MDGDNCAGKTIEMLVALGQHQRRAPLPGGLRDLVADEPVAAVVGDQLRW